MSRKLKLHYSTDGDLEWATIETQDGWYFCTVERTTGEGRRRFRDRARSIQDALERHKGPLVTLSPKFC